MENAWKQKHSCLYVSHTMAAINCLLENFYFNKRSSSEIVTIRDKLTFLRGLFSVRQEASFQWHSQNLLLIRRGEEDWTERERESLFGKEIFSEPLNREITERNGTDRHTHTHTLSGNCTITLYTVHIHSYTVTYIHTHTHVRQDYTEVRVGKLTHIHASVRIPLCTLPFCIFNGRSVCLWVCVCVNKWRAALIQ